MTAFKVTFKKKNNHTVIIVVETGLQYVLKNQKVYIYNVFTLKEAVQYEEANLSSKRD